MSISNGMFSVVIYDMGRIQAGNLRKAAWFGYIDVLEIIDIESAFYVCAKVLDHFSSSCLLG